MARAARREEPLWDRIERERLKVGIFVGLFVLSVGVSAGAIVGAAMFVLGVFLVHDPASGPTYFGAVPWVAAAAFAGGIAVAAVYAARSLTRPEMRLLHRFGATWTDAGAHPRAKSALHDMALASGFEHAPPLWVIEGCTRINACVLGLKPSAVVVAVTEGFLTRLDPDDQRAVFANLMARVRLGDALWATAVSALAGPLWRVRERDLRRQEEEDGTALAVDEIVRDPAESVQGVAATGGTYVPLLLFAVLGVILTELLMAGHERAALVAAEKADAEGMLLLKDPREMLAALEKVLEANNTVPGAGEAYSMVFYCWAGFGFAPEDDPEMVRVERLREVLGAEGSATAG